MRVFGADQNTMPLPPAGPGGFDQDKHLAAEQVGGQSAEHPLADEGGMVLESLKDPFVVECLHGLPRLESYAEHKFDLMGVCVHSLLVVI